MDLSLAPKQPCQMKSQREFCKSKLLPSFSLLLSFTELAKSPQHIQQRCHPDIWGIQSLARPRYISHIGEIHGLASISSTGVIQTLDEYKA